MLDLTPTPEGFRQIRQRFIEANAKEQELANKLQAWLDEDANAETCICTLCPQSGTDSHKLSEWQAICMVQSYLDAVDKVMKERQAEIDNIARYLVEQERKAQGR